MDPRCGGNNFIVYGQAAINLMGSHWIDNGNQYIDDDDERYDAAGFAAQLGVNYQLKNLILWFQFDTIGGDDPGSEDCETFLAPAESQALTMIVEGSDRSNFGYNRSTNMNAIRLGCTAAISRNLEVNAVFGNYSKIEDEALLGPGFGNEVDVSVTWFYSDNVYFNAGLAFYFPDDEYATNDMVMVAVGKVSASF